MNGPDQHPLFKFLKATRGGIRGFYRDNIKWNFAKFVIGKDGVVIERFTPTTSPKMIEVHNYSIADSHSLYRNHNFLCIYPVCKLMRTAVKPHAWMSAVKQKFLRSLLFPPKDDGSGGKKEIRSAQCSRLVMDCADCTGTYWETAWGPKGGELFWGEERKIERPLPIKKPERRGSMPPPPKKN